jgi:hypothetical protein
MKSLLQSIMYCLVFLCIDASAASNSSASSSSAAAAARPARASASSAAVPPLALSKDDVARKDSFVGKGSPNKDGLTPRGLLYKKIKKRFDDAWDAGDAREIEKMLNVLEEMYKTDHLDLAKFIHYEQMLNVGDVGIFLKEKRALLNRYEKEAKEKQGEVAAFKNYFKTNRSLLERSLTAFKKAAAPLQSSSYDLIVIAHEAFNIQEQWNSLKDFVDNYPLSNLILHEMGNNEKDPKEKIVWHIFKANMDKEVAHVMKNYQQLMQEYKTLYAQFTQAVGANNKGKAEAIKKLIDDQFKITGFEKNSMESIPDIVEILKMNYEINSLINALPGRVRKESDDKSVPDFLIEWDKELSSLVAQCEQYLSEVHDVESLVHVMKKYMGVLIWSSQAGSFFKKSDRNPEKIKQLSEHLEKRMLGLIPLETQMKKQVYKTKLGDLSLLLNQVNVKYEEFNKRMKTNLNNSKNIDGIFKLLQEALPQYLLLFIAESIETEVAESNHNDASSDKAVSEKSNFEKAALLSQLLPFKDFVMRLIKTLDNDQVKKHFSEVTIQQWRNKAEAFLTWVDNEDNKKLWADPF